MNLFQRMFPNLQTDHGGFTFGDFLVIVMTIGSTIFTSWKSYDILRHTMATGDSAYAVVAIGGLFFLDIGMVFWSLIWMFGSSTRFQDWLSLTMWGVDTLGVFLTVLADTFLYVGEAGEIVELVRQLVWWGIAPLAIGNLVAATVYHYTHPAVIRRRKERRMAAELELLRIEGEAEARRAELEVGLARDLVLRRREALEAYESLVDLHKRLEAIEQSLAAALLGERTNGNFSLLQGMMGRNKKKAAGAKAPAAQPSNSHSTTFPQIE